MSTERGGLKDEILTRILHLTKSIVDNTLIYKNLCFQDPKKNSALILIAEPAVHYVSANIPSQFLLIKIN